MLPTSLFQGLRRKLYVWSCQLLPVEVGTMCNTKVNTCRHNSIATEVAQQFKTNICRCYLTRQEGISRLKRYELMEIEQHVEQCACQGLVPLQISRREAALLGRLDHVMHLTQHILK